MKHLNRSLSTKAVLNLVHRSNGQALLNAKIGLLLKKFYAWGVTTHQPAQLGKLTSEVTFQRTPFSSTFGTLLRSRTQNSNLHVLDSQ